MFLIIIDLCNFLSKDLKEISNATFKNITQWYILHPWYYVGLKKWNLQLEVICSRESLNILQFGPPLLYFHTSGVQISSYLQAMNIAVSPTNCSFLLETLSIERYLSTTFTVRYNVSGISSNFRCTCRLQTFQNQTSKSLLNENSF